MTQLLYNSVVSKGEQFPLKDSILKERELADDPLLIKHFLQLLSLQVYKTNPTDSQ